ncbi:MAG: hypothetical protein A2X84_06665 [Desulfuromonadaceae bacterium GWC2_58_13]|nr:MAG: hypothetical protein A2X84_06665 [Desulfuromonadaceae bacterium GWC2_58_13]
MFSCTFIPALDQRPAMLQVSGEATIQHIQQFKEALVEGLKAQPDLVIDCGQVTEADLSCLQLLCAAHRGSPAIKLLPEPSSAIRDLIEPSGFARAEECCNTADPRGCLWVRAVTAPRGEDC